MSRWADKIPPLKVREGVTLDDTFSVIRHSARDYVLFKKGSNRARWGTRKEIMEDAEYAQENGSLPGKDSGGF